MQYYLHFNNSMDIDGIETMEDKKNEVVVLLAM